MIKARKIELLAPAKNLECGIEAINHGADAVYIGAPQFSARASAGNTIEDIAQLTHYAHQYNARVYVALNTILTDEELQKAEKLIWDLYRNDVDALIVQDMGITQLNLPPIALHASTQTDNRTVEKVKFFEEAGFTQVVLARELTIDEIKDISSQVSVPLEAFVHGALCVSYSGQCYLSEALANRSANKGACAQLCRLPYSLVDSEGRVVVQKKHLLSMKDLNLSEQLEELLDAGVTSLKIEGRLKDLSYVKNVVAYYRQKLDKIIEKRPEYYRSSSGVSSFLFNPNLEKSFNRGFTQYFLHGRGERVWSLDSPKSIGEPIGKVKDVFDRFFVLSGTKILNNGDGLCFLNGEGELQGFRVNRVDGEKIFPYEENIQVRKGTLVHRNYDKDFEKILTRKTAERKIGSSITLREISIGLVLDMEDEDGNAVSITFECLKELANKDQFENIKNNLSKTGNTIFRVDNVDIQFSQNWFIPSSIITEQRRLLTERLLQVRLLSYQKQIIKLKATNHAFPDKELTYLGNVMNNESVNFYSLHGTTVKELAFEKKQQKNRALMFTRHCIKQSMGWCPKEKQPKNAYKEPFYLIQNGVRLRLEFNCIDCEMRVINDNKSS